MKGIFRKHRELIAREVQDKMISMGECQNLQDIILGVISPKDFPCSYTVHCLKDCFRTDCPSYQFLMEEKKFDNS